MPTVKIDFFQLYPEPENGQGDLATALQELYEMPSEARALPVSGGWIHLMSLTDGQRSLSGILFKAKTDELPALANRSGVLQDLTVGDDEGIAGLTHFYYRPSNRILLLQRNMQGVRQGAFETYFRQKINLDIELRVVIQDGAMQRLQRMQRISKVSFKLATPHAATNVRYGRSINEIVRLMDEHNAPEVEITLAMGRRRGGTLSVQNVINTAQRLLRLHATDAHQVGKILAFGGDEEGSVAIDLIKDRIVEMAPVAMGANKRLLDSECAEALAGAYRKREAEIVRNYGR